MSIDDTGLSIVSRAIIRPEKKKVDFSCFERFGLVIYISEVRFGKISTTKLGFPICQTILNVNLKNIFFTFVLPGSLSTTQ